MVGLRLVCSAESLPTHLHVQDLSHVLHDKVPLFDVASRPQAPPPGPRVERNGVGVLEPPHLLVVAEEADRTRLWVALHVDGSVDADGVVVTGALRQTLAGQGVEVIIIYRGAGHQVFVDL